MPFAGEQVTYAYDLNAWWQTKATPAALFETISIVTIFVAPLLVAAMNVVEVRSANNITAREISWNGSSIASSNSVALPLVMKNGLPISLL